VKRNLYFSLASLIILIAACTRVDTTELGDELIPAVDYVNTFDTTIDVFTDNFILNDSIRTFSDDDQAVGYISSDPEFGRTAGEMYFSVSPAAFKTYPFVNKDSVKIDSVVLSLGYRGAYGDTTIPQTFRVFDIGQNAGFKDSAYKISHPPFSPLGPELANVTTTFAKLRDTLLLKRLPDTPKINNVLRFKLDTAFGRKFVNMGIDSNATGGYFSDSIFQTMFRGFAVKTDRTTGNGLGYFNLADAKTKFIIYFRVTKDGKTDTTFVTFTHRFTAQANVVERIPSGSNYDTYMGNTTSNDDKLYIQSSPGSYATVRIPALSTLSNRVIHRAELIFPRITTANENTFGLPALLFLDMITADGDSALTIQNDFVLGQSNTANFDIFGGAERKSDATYRFNISRHVQGIVTRHENNYTLRLYAPFETAPYYFPPGKASDYAPGNLGPLTIQAVPRIAQGRAVLEGGSSTNPGRKARLYIVYSKI